MFQPNNRIIIADDVEEHLMILAKCFLNTGIGCRTILYDELYNEPLKGVRIAFFDINITNKSIDLTATTYDYKLDRTLSSAFNDLANAISNCIHVDNGPYALIFWSSNTKLITNFTEFVRDTTKGFTGLPSPILIDSIDKDVFLSENIENITNKIKSIFNKKSIELLLDFQDKCNFSAAEIIDIFYKIIPKNPLSKDQKWGSHVDFEPNFDKIFSKIAHSTLGYDYSASNPDKAIAEALLPIHNNLVKKQMTNSKIWKNGLSKISSKSVKYPVGFYPSKLNSIFHVDETISSDKEVRGGIIKINMSRKKTLSEFKITSLSEWINKLIPFKSEFADEQKNIVNDSELIALEISAACDFTNKKKRINKYILGIITPSFDVKSKINQEFRPEYSYHIGDANFNLCGADFQIWLNLNFVFGAHPNDIRLGEIKFILKKEIMDMIGNKYASHVSRIGITSF